MRLFQPCYQIHWHCTWYEAAHQTLFVRWISPSPSNEPLRLRKTKFSDIYGGSVNLVEEIEFMYHKLETPIDTFCDCFYSNSKAVSFGICCVLQLNSSNEMLVSAPIFPPLNPSKLSSLNQPIRNDRFGDGWKILQLFSSHLFLFMIRQKTPSSNRTQSKVEVEEGRPGSSQKWNG